MIVSNRPIIGITMGDACGIGPEIIVKALAHKEIYDACRPVIIGDAKIIKKVLPIVESGLKINQVNEPEEATFKYGTIDVIDMNLLPDELPFGQVSAEAGNAAYEYLAKSVELAKEKRIHSICTAPLNKEA